MDDSETGNVEMDAALARRMQEMEWQHLHQQPERNINPLAQNNNATNPQGLPVYQGYNNQPPIFNSNMAAGFRNIDYYGGDNRAAMYGTVQNVLPDIYISEHERKLMATYSLGRGIKLLALLDGFLLVFNASFFPLLVFFLWGPVSGWISGHYYQLMWATLYFGYYILRIVADTSMIAFGAFWFIISLLVDLWIARFVYMYIELLKRCSVTDLEQIRMPRRSIWSSSMPYFSAL